MGSSHRERRQRPLAPAPAREQAAQYYIDPLMQSADLGMSMTTTGNQYEPVPQLSYIPFESPTQTTMMDMESLTSAPVAVPALYPVDPSMSLEGTDGSIDPGL